jgi:predicted MFS family arabinose efflux permease
VWKLICSIPGFWSFSAVNFGSAFGTAVGGMVLLSFDYEGLGVVLGVMGIVAALVFFFFARDPTRK